MTTSNQIHPGMTLQINGKLYRVDSSVKVTVPKGTPFIKTKLRDLGTGKVVEKNFKLNQKIAEASLLERRLEFLYPEGDGYLFLDLDNLEQVQVQQKVVGEHVQYLKEGVEVRATFYGDKPFSIELPQFLELMVAETSGGTESGPVSDVSLTAQLETGAKVEVPPFIEAGDVIKVDTRTNEFVQRV